MTRRIYLDNHATTPTDPRVVEAMAPYFGTTFGNPSSPHVFGWEAAEAIDTARGKMAAALRVDPKEIVFTSGATESNNLALRGAMARHVARGRHLVITTIEHPSVADTAADLERQGCDVTRVGVDARGLVDPQEVLAALRDDTVLCSVIAASNEIGTLQPIEAIAEGCRARGVLFHTDATQAVGKVPLDASVADLVSLSAHKVYGPKGVGLLTVRRRNPRVRLAAQLTGGGQQDRLRPGTLATPLLVGMGVALEIAVAELDAEAPRLRSLRDRMLARLQADLEQVLLNGDPKARLPGNLNVCFLGVEAQSLLLQVRDIGLSVGSACSADRHDPSPVLLALGRTAEQAHSSIRIGLGRFNTQDEVDEAAGAIAEAVTRLRSATPVHGAAPTEATRRRKARVR